jgi:glycosidase
MAYEMKLPIKIISLFLLTFIITACTPASQPTLIAEPTQTPEVSPSAGPWWNETVFYEIFVRSFRDSDGDGIGDFNGITEKLDTLQDLGVRGIWLMPINPSPSYHGYDVTDYYAINPDYGTLADFERLLDEAHKREIKIIIDLVLNHTSSQHPWFKSALTPGSETHDWYKWSETDPRTPGPWGQKTWYQASNGQYYYAIFWDQMPDLNYDNDAVQEEAKKITSFWLNDVGIDGFRLDAVRYLAEDQKLADASSNHAFLAEWGEYYRSVNPQAFTVGEAWTDNANVKEYISTDTELDAAFNFDLSAAILKSLNESNNTSVRFLLQTTVRDFPQQDNANFLTNHDMPRVMNQLGENKEDKAKAAAGILLTAPGIPFIYYGEEIGMSGTKPDELIRTPMQWTGESGAGFTDGTPWEPINADFAAVNVADQTGDPTSLLEHYRELILLRNAHSALRTGKTYVAESKSNKLVTYLRADEGETLLVLINIDDAPVTGYQLELGRGPLSGSYAAASLLDEVSISSLQANETGGFDAYTPLAEVPPYGVMVIQLTQ